jgi:hypothetical protein
VCDVHYFKFLESEFSGSKHKWLCFLQHIDCRVSGKKLKWSLIF